MNRRLNLADIEDEAAGLVSRLMRTQSARDAQDIATRLDGLKSAAQIVAARDQRSKQDAGLPAVDRCGYRWVWNSTVDGAYYETCTRPTKHDGEHCNEVTGEWTTS